MVHTTNHITQDYNREKISLHLRRIYTQMFVNVGRYCYSKKRRAPCARCDNLKQDADGSQNKSGVYLIGLIFIK